MFYAPWCGHCTRMKGDYSKAAKIVADSKIGVLAAMDSTTNSKTQSKFEIKGFPTLKYFEKGVLKNDYKGLRTAEDLVAFIKNGGVAVKDEF